MPVILEQLGRQLVKLTGKFAGIELRIGRQNIDHIMWRQCPFGQRCLSRTNVEALVDLHGIGRNDRALQALRKVQRVGRFAHARGADDGNEVLHEPEFA